MDTPKAFQLTGDGAINADWGEMTLWAGTPLKRLNSRVRTLDEGCLPAFNYGSLIDDIKYRVKTFAAPTGLDPIANHPRHVARAFCPWPLKPKVTPESTLKCSLVSGTYNS